MNLSSLSSFNTSDKIIIDANVLIYVYCPLNSAQYDDYISHYSEILEKISKAKASVYVNSLIISEFINRWLRMDFKKSAFSNEDFKRDYRASERYRNTMRVILSELKKFYRQHKVNNIDDNFSNIDFLSYYEKDIQNDLNDIIIAENSISNGCKLLTQDGDFSKYGNIKVIK